MKEIIFYYDVICPYANLASKLIEEVARRNGAKLIWRPVLLGGIYKETKNEKAVIPDNKMIKTYSNQKRKTLGNDLAMQYVRYNVPISTYKVPDIRTLNAMRLLASTSDETGHLRKTLTHSLFDAVWKEQKDVSDLKILQSIADSVDYKIDINSFVEDKAHPARSKLLENTLEAVGRGAFGVPSMWVNNRLYFGSDRLFFVEHELGNLGAKPHQLMTKPSKPSLKKKLKFYFDFSSPWTFLGYQQIPKMLESVRGKGVDVEIEYIPILLGGLFKSIGTPVVPMQSMGENKRNYYTRDLMDWLKWTQVKFQYTTNFPLLSVHALRMYLACPTQDLRNALFNAAWINNKDISNAQVLEEIVSLTGLKFQEIAAKSKSTEIKQELIQNTQNAVDMGISGLPSFQVDDNPIVFGQDRLNVVEDMLLGWDMDASKIPESKL